jgi:uncharacterized protein with HEPN domain
MITRDIQIYFEDILSALDKIKQYVGGLTLEQFRLDDKTQDAVIRNFSVVGEAVKRIPDKVKNAYPQIPRRSASGMRDFLIHDYPNIVPDIVWNTAINDLPKFTEQILKVMSDLENT